MKEFDYVIKDALGLHARPAGLLVKAAGAFTSEIKLEAKGKSIDAKRIMAVMGLGVKGGDTLKVKVDGADEAKAAQELKDFLEKNL